MFLHSPGAVFLHFGPLSIRWYGVMIALGFFVALEIGKYLATRSNLNPQAVSDTVFISFLGGILGARLYFVSLNLPYFSKHLNEVLAIWLGGMSIHGGIIGGLLAGLIYVKKNKLPFIKILDIASVVLPIGQAIGRFGNFFNQEAFGTPVAQDYFLKLYIDPPYRPIKYFAYSYFHPTFLYESVLDFLIFAILFILFFKLPKNGQLFGIYMILYSIARLIVEPIRTDSITYNNFPIPIIASYVYLSIGTLILIYINRDLLKKSKN